MMNFIYTYIIFPMFRKIIEANQHYYHLKGMDDERKNSREMRELIDRQQLHNYVCISIGEGSVNLVVGRVLDWLDSVPIIEDVVSGKHMTCFGVTMRYSEENLKALYQLDPEQRYNLLAKLAHPRMGLTKTDPSEQVPIEFILKQVREKYGAEKRAGTAGIRVVEIE